VINIQLFSSRLKCELSMYSAAIMLCFLCLTTVVSAADPLKLYGGGVQSQEMEDLSNKICGKLIVAQESTGENSAKVIERSLLKHLNITKKTPSYKTTLTKFWNKNLDQMICTRRVVGLKAPQHIMKRVIDMRLDSGVYFDFIFELNDNVKVNAISLNSETGQPETVVDYIDTILTDPSNKTKYVFREIKDLKEVLIDEYNAKTANELMVNR